MRDAKPDGVDLKLECIRFADGWGESAQVEGGGNKGEGERVEGVGVWACGSAGEQEDGERPAEAAENERPAAQQVCGGVKQEEGGEEKRQSVKRGTWATGEGERQQANDEADGDSGLPAQAAEEEGESVEQGAGGG
jgi:hypothetical protein